MKKGLYGLKQAGRQWNLRLLEEICNLGFIQCKSDSCLFVKITSSIFIILLVFVDDILIIFNDFVVYNNLVYNLSKIFRLSVLGPVSWFLGFEIKCIDNYIILSQSNYCKSIVKRFGFENSRFSRVPAQQNTKLLVNNKKLSCTYHYDYASAVGSLMYCVVGTRVDLSMSVHSVCRFMASPAIEHYYAVDCIFRYLASNYNYSLLFKGIDLDLVGYCDADWAEDINDRKSVSGFVFVLGGTPVVWGTQKQSCVALSTQEAEYIAISVACRELVWLRYLLSELRVLDDRPSVIYSDNRAAIALAHDPIQHKRNKHIDIKYHYIRDLIYKKYIQLDWISGSEMLADFLTKAVGYNKFREARDRLMYLSNRG